MPKPMTDPLRQLYRAVLACERAMRPDAIAARNAAIERQREADRRLASIAKDESEYYASQEFRDEVIAALLAEGLSEDAARNRIRDGVRFHNEACRLGLK